jgi:hypothetical protein
LAKATISLAAITASAILGDYLGDLVNEARKTKYKDKIAADKARTNARKNPTEPREPGTEKHTGDATEAHKDQKNQGSLELGDKIDGQQGSSEIFSSDKSQQNLIEKAKEEAQDFLEKSKQQTEPKEEKTTDDGGKTDEKSDETSKD